MAMWDVIGQALGVAVSQLLGGWTDRMRVSHMLGFHTPERTVEEAQSVRDRVGSTSFKVKVARRPVT